MRFILLILISFLAFPAFSIGYQQAVTNYDKGDFQTAIDQFKHLSSYGNKDAQYAVGTMYLEGKGVDKNMLEAYAWIKLSSSEKKAPNSLLSKLSKKLKEKDLVNAENHYQALLQKYGEQKLKQSIYPILKVPSSDSSEDLLAIAKPQPRYPNRASKSKITGDATVEYSVGKDGRTRYHRIVYSDHSFFNAPSLKAARTFKYEPRSTVVHNVRNRFSYRMSSVSGKSHLGTLEENSEEAPAQRLYVYGYNSIHNWKYLDEKTRVNPLNWFLPSAIDGHAASQYELGRVLLFGEYSEKDVSKSLFWLNQSAKFGNTDAQLMLGQIYIDGDNVEKDREKGLFWLSKAAESGDANAKVQYAHSLVLGSTDKKTIAQARQFLDSVDPGKYYDKLSLHEANAALYALENNFKIAIRSQKNTIKESKIINFDSTLLKQNLQSLKEGKLLTQLDRIVPIENE